MENKNNCKNETVKEYTGSNKSGSQNQSQNSTNSQNKK